MRLIIVAFVLAGACVFVLADALGFLSDGAPLNTEALVGARTPAPPTAAPASTQSVAPTASATVPRPATLAAPTAPSTARTTTPIPGSAALPPQTTDPRAPWIGVNNWALAASSEVQQGCGGDAERILEQKMTHLKAAGVDVVRFAAYQAYATDEGHERNWIALDRVFASASAHGMRLIPILGNNWNDCDYWGARPVSDAKDTGTPFACGGSGNWYDVGYQLPYNGYLTGYRQWATDMVGRYAGHPALAAWELVNEPWESCIHDFFVDVIGVVRAADPETPISLGSAGGGEAWTRGSGYRRETALADWATMHDYEYPDDPLPVTPGCPEANCLRSALADAAALGKPFYVGEAGILESEACDSVHRADQLRAKMRAAFAAGASGYIVWAYSELAPAGMCGMDFGPDSPIMRIFADF